MATWRKWQSKPKPRKLCTDELVHFRTEARRKYPFLDFDDAFVKWSYDDNPRGRNVWWWNGAGQRCIILDDLDCRFDKSYAGKLRYLVEDYIDSRTYLSYCKTPMFDKINKPKPNLRKYEAHESQRPLAPPSHLSRLPNEIKDIILAYVLSVPADLTIRPRPITTNWKREWNMHPGFTIDGIRHYQDTRRVHRTRYDNEGQYVEYRRLILAAIDATCLRVHPKMRDYGAGVLYGSNTFAFSMLIRDREHCPPYALDNRTFWPSPQKPRVNCPSILEAMAHIHDGHTYDSEDHLRILFTHLHGWVYYDPFLRFLYTSQPRNAALIKTLSFDGIVQRHNKCSSESCQKRGVYLRDDLVMSLRLYILFIRTFCINLEKLIIIAWDDHRVLHCRHHNHLDESLPKSMKEALLPLLENEVRGIRSLREIEVIIDEEKGEDADDFEFARETVTWFQGRTAERDSRKREFDHMRANAKPVQERAKDLKAQLRLVQAQEDLMHEKAKIVQDLCRNCEFCGEEHASLECCHLCNFCGDFGHWRDTCKKLAAAEPAWEIEMLIKMKEAAAEAETDGQGCEDKNDREINSGYQTNSGAEFWKWRRSD